MSLSKDVSYLLNILFSLLTLTVQWIWTLSPVNKAASSLACEQALNFKCLAKQATRERASDAAKGEATRAKRKRMSEGQRKGELPLSFPHFLARALPFACRSRVTSHYIP